MIVWARVGTLRRVLIQLDADELNTAVGGWLRHRGLGDRLGRPFLGDEGRLALNRSKNTP